MGQLLRRPGTANFVGGAGKNEFRIEAKLTDPSVPFVPGNLNDNPTADNTVILDRNGVANATTDSVILRPIPDSCTSPATSRT